MLTIKMTDKGHRGYRAFRLIVGGLVVLYLLIAAVLWAFQRNIIYLPTPESGRTDADFVWLENQGEQLKVWHIAPEEISADTPIIIYFGGNGDGAEQYIDSFRAAFTEQRLKAELYLPHYRGYGGSSGEPSEAALYSDAKALFDLIREKSPSQSIVVIGRSLGTGLATYLSNQREIDSLVLITPYDSMTKVVQEKLWMFPVWLMLTERFPSAEYAEQISVPTLVFMASKDQVISRERTENLYDAIGSKYKQKVEILNAGHNSILQKEDMMIQIADFFASE